MPVSVCLNRLRCPRCEKARPRSDFNRCKARKNGLVGWCRDCQKASRTERADHYRDYEFKRRYGIGLLEYDLLMEAQGGVCAICHEDCIQKPNLAVDHCHSSGRVRGLLCGRCNQAIGLLRERADLMRAAIDYLGVS